MGGGKSTVIISIHAPTRGATCQSWAMLSIRPEISIHAPTRGATLQGRKWPTIHAISIHAPTRGATLDWYVLEARGRFQSTLPRGERPVPIHDGDGVRQFQSTLPRGERLRALPNLKRTSLISIHAPTRGATGSINDIASWVVDFNPRSHAGSDLQARDGRQY